MYSKKWEEDTLRFNSLSGCKLKCRCGHKETPRQYGATICGVCGREILSKQRFKEKLYREIDRKTKR